MNRFIASGFNTSSPDSPLVTVARIRDSFLCVLTDSLYGDFPRIDRARVRPTVCRNQIKTYHNFTTRTARPIHQIVYGRTLMRNTFFNGFSEYPSVEPHVRRFGYLPRRITGMRAMFWVAMHEFAHVLQSEDGQRKTGEAHNRYFIAMYTELLETYSPAEAFSRFIPDRDAAFLARNFPNLT